MQIKVYTIDFKLPRWLKRGTLLVAIPLLVVGIAAGVRAAVVFPIPLVEDYKDGDKLTAGGTNGLNAKLNDLRDAANTLAASINSLQGGLTTAQSQISTIGTKLDTAGVKVTLRNPENRSAALAGGAFSGWFNSNECTTDEILVGGGCLATDGSVAVNAMIIADYAEGKHWMCAFKNNGAATFSITAIATCAKFSLAF
jgi:hypothetical protein